MSLLVVSDAMRQQIVGSYQWPCLSFEAPGLFRHHSFQQSPHASAPSQPLNSTQTRKETKPSCKSSILQPTPNSTQTKKTKPKPTRPSISINATLCLFLPQTPSGASRLFTPSSDSAEAFTGQVSMKPQARAPPQGASSKNGDFGGAKNQSGEKLYGPMEAPFKSFRAFPV